MDRAAFLAVVLCWLVLGAAFAFRRRSSPVRESRREPAWKFGLLLQAASMLVLLASPRTRYTPLLSVGPLLETTVAVTAVFLATGSAWVIWEAQRVLGRHFAYQARLIEGHRLITHGPYGWVRNPQYAALFVLGEATAVTWSRWTALPAFLALYAAGTAIRVRCEEKLLREAFGEEFEAYRRRVPALLPGLNYLRRRGVHCQRRT